MKNLTVLPFLLFVLAFQAPVSGQISDCRPANYMLQSVVNIIAKIKQINGFTNLGLMEGTSIMGTHLTVGGTVSWNTELQRGRQYVFIGGGDDDVTDLDIYIKDLSGTTLKKDEAADNKPVVVFTPQETKKYTITLKLYRSLTAGSFACLALLQENGYVVPVDNYTTAAANLFRLVTAVCEKMGMSYLSTPNQWSFYGGVYDAGETIGIQNIKLKNKTTVALAAGDSNTRDIDLWVKDQATNETLGSNTKADATPFVILDGNASKNYIVETKNVTATGHSLILMSLIEVNTTSDGSVIYRH